MIYGSEPRRCGYTPSRQRSRAFELRDQIRVVDAGPADRDRAGRVDDVVNRNLEMIAAQTTITGLSDGSPTGNAEGILYALAVNLALTTG